ncbi:transcriptional regulator [Tamlana sp. s12]|uniref:GbsR/MarR family transcriptional regulator n=1 Tax=Tamlana sp. s12 TaxID=1630406 RepID=UPI00293D9269|nr:transcriptional regulator [Tamlana sp. s12]
MMNDNVCKDKMILVEKFGVFLEKREQLAPVAARIFAYIVLTGKSGTTFDNLVQVLCASKSTISTNLNHLQDLKKIEYFTKTGDRKKYFKVNDNSILQKIDEMIFNWTEEREIHTELMNYKKTINALDTVPHEEKFDLTIHNDFVHFIDNATSAINDLKEKIIKTQSKLK